MNYPSEKTIGIIIEILFKFHGQCKRAYYVVSEKAYIFLNKKKRFARFHMFYESYNDGGIFSKSAQ